MKRFRSYKIKFRVFQYTLSDGPLVKVECVIIVVDLRHVWFQTPSSHSGIQKPSMRKVYESREIVVFLKTDFTFWLQTLHLELWANYVQGVKRKTKKTKTKNKQKKEQKFTFACLSIRLQFVACETSTCWLVTRSFEANLWASMISRTRVYSYENNTH